MKKKSIFKETPYPTLLEGERRAQQSGNALWFRQAVVLALVVLLFAMDWINQFSAFDAVLTENQWIGMMLSLCLALVFNVIPLILGKFIKDYQYHRGSKSVKPVIFLVVTFFLVFAISAAFRWNTRELSFAAVSSVTSNSSVVVTNPEMTVLTETTAPGDDPGARTLTILLAALPLITSIVSTFLGYVSSDPILDKLNFYKQRIYELYEAKKDGTAAVGELKERIGQIEQYEYESYCNARTMVAAKIHYLEGLAMKRLEEEIGNPDAVNYLSEERGTRLEGGTTA